MARIFVSHSTKDSAEFVTPIVEILRRKGHVCWFNSAALGTRIDTSISQALDDSEVFLIFQSKNYEESNYCKDERSSITSICSRSAKPKPRFVVVLGSGPVPALYRGTINLVYRLGETHEEMARQLDAAITTPLGFRDATGPERTIADEIFHSEQKGVFGANLLRDHDEPNTGRLMQEEGLILVKPGGTFYRPCLEEILRRVLKRAHIKQVRLYDGKTVDQGQMFENLYSKQSSYANGGIRLSDEDYARIKRIYDTPHFHQAFGVNYAPDLVRPALSLCHDERLDGDLVTEKWEAGRQPGLWQNQRHDGLNKIGYQRSVFPVRLNIAGKERVFMLLNGYIPGLRKLFTDPAARLVAIHAVTEGPWAEIRNFVVGGESDPAACPPGSIRYDALTGALPLDPAYRESKNSHEVVNGQKNVCHSSATALDAFRELLCWFNYSPERMLLGRLFVSAGVRPETVMEQDEGLLASLSITTRDDDLRKTFADLRFEQVKVRLNDGNDANRLRREFAEANAIASVVMDHVRGSETLFVNAARLEVGGDDVFVTKILEMMPQEWRHACVSCQEILEFIRDLSKNREPHFVLAEAYRIAAGDLMWLELPVYSGEISRMTGNVRCPYPMLLRSRIVAELPEQALDCARRTFRNILMSAYALDQSPVPAYEKLENTPAWAEFVGSCSLAKSPSSNTVGLILCGGRSTRMSSTIPKAILSLRGRFLFDWVRDFICTACPNADIYAATGYRGDILDLAVSGRAKFLDYSGLHGVGFRVAACLHALRGHEGVVILSYCDMPNVSPLTVARLIERIQKHERAFGLVVTWADALSGQVQIVSNVVKRIDQLRLHPGGFANVGWQDVGVYVFKNTPEFRAALGSIRNDNVRGEFMFADVVAELSRRGWPIFHEIEDASRTLSVNTAGDLLQLTSGVHEKHVPVERCVYDLNNELRLKMPIPASREQLTSEFSHHFGPVYFFHRWNEVWRSGHQRGR